ncbi:hypothetical protein [Luteolibacter soli]|uniref:Uncharacterized protein n=1 Tax=Luteolibacter soli TaxID=3135280 RepID=A0ABU9AZ75_9BACT
MPDPAERFIEAAVRPLADNAELQLMAAQELRSVLSQESGEHRGDSLEQAAANLETARPKSRAKVILYVAAALAVVLAAIPLARDYVRLRLASYDLFAMTDPAAIGLPGLPFGPDIDQKVPGLFGPLTAPERLLLFGDPSQPSKADVIKSLWDSDPGNPALFADYARTVASGPDIPPDLLKTADRLDPQNAWFRYLAAGAKARGNINELPVPSHVLKLNPKAPRYHIFDTAGQAEAIRLFQEATRLPSMKSYEHELLLQRLKILPPGDDVLGRKLTASYLHMVVPRTGASFGHLSQAIAARAEELAIAGDREGFVALTDAWEIFARRSIGNDGSILFPFSSLPAFTRAARMLGLASQEARYSSLEAAIGKRKEAQSQRTDKLVKQWRGLAEDAGGGILLAGAAVESPPPISLADLIPGEMAAREMWRRIASAMVGVVVLMVLLLAAGGRFTRGKQAQALSEALVQVLRPSDHRWIVGVGIILPIVIHLLLEWLLPLTTASATQEAGLATFLRFGALAGAILLLPAQFASRRLGLRLGCLGWPRPRVLSVVASATMMTIATATGWSQSEGAHILGGTLVIALLAVIIINLAVGVPTCPRHHAVRFLTWGRSLVPAYATGLLLMALLVPFHHAREKHWTKLNVLTKIEPRIPAANRYEYEVDQQERKDLLELLDA